MRLLARLIVSVGRMPAGAVVDLADQLQLSGETDIRVKDKSFLLSLK